MAIARCRPSGGRVVLLVAAATALVAFDACDRHAVPRDATPADVLVSVGKGRIAAPDSVRAGWTRVRVEEDGGGHIVVVFRLTDAVAADGAMARFLAELDTAAATPQLAVAMGGPEIGDVGDVVVHLTPGRYLLGCVRRGADGHRHVSTGEARTFVVPRGPSDSTHAAPPHATQDVRMIDFAYVGPDTWAAGHNMLRVENTGRQDHQLRLVRLRAGSSMTDWARAADPDEHASPVAGIARMGPGQVAYLPVELPAGAYVVYCLVTDPATRRPHVELGMMRAIRVE